MNKQCFVQEPARQIPVTHQVDLVVAGGGTAGVACAICAARMGLSVVLLEQTAQPGGMVTCVTQWLSDFADKGGFPKEFLTLLEQNDFYRKPYYNGARLITWFDKMLQDAGVIPLYLTKVASPIMDGSRVKGIIVESKQGRHAILAGMTVDATGDGDVACRAGASFEVGRPEDGQIQAMSLSMLMANCHADALNIREEIEPELRKVNPNYELPYSNGYMRLLPGSETAILCSLPHVCGFNPLEAESLSKALVEMRRQGEEFVELMKQTPIGKGMEGFWFSALPGVRESRRIVCDAMVSDEDWQIGQKYPDGIITVSHNVDIHKCREGEPHIIVEKANPYQIRYGALLPRGLDNLMVVGRCIGGSHKALASYRLIADCMAMGEVAAIAAFQAIRATTDLRSIPIQNLRGELNRRGYRLE